MCLLDYMVFFAVLANMFCVGIGFCLIIFSAFFTKGKDTRAGGAHKNSFISLI